MTSMRSRSGCSDETISPPVHARDLPAIVRQRARTDGTSPLEWCSALLCLSHRLGSVRRHGSARALQRPQEITFSPTRQFGELVANPHLCWLLHGGSLPDPFELSPADGLV